MPAWPRTVTVGSFLADVDSGTDFRATTSMTGWDDAAPIEVEIEPQAQQDGGWDATGYHRPRVVGIEGEVLQSSHTAAHAVRDELVALTPRSMHQLVVASTGLTGERSAMVRVSRGAAVQWLGPCRFRYSLELTAPDPLKYGPAVFDQSGLSSASGGTGLVYPLAYPLDYGVAPGATPGAIALANAGTASYLPRLRIDGPVTNPVVTLAETGDRVAYAGVVAAGQWLDIDCARRRVLLNGQVSMRHRVSFVGAWLAVPVGGATVTWTADDADPAALLSVWSFESAWL